MTELKKTQEPFRFYTRLHLTELTGLKASTSVQLSELIKQVPDACIYHHTHRFLQQHQYLSPEPPNDFAYWVTEILGEENLGERLASIDMMQFSTIDSLRKQIVSTIEDYMESNPSVKNKFANKNDEFHFIKSISFILPANYIAYNLKEFADILKKITIDSIYFHIFEARLRLGKGVNDFSNWIENSIGDRNLAKKISNLDPYTYTLDALRKIIIDIIEKKAKI